MHKNTWPYNHELAPIYKRCGILGKYEITKIQKADAQGMSHKRWRLEKGLNRTKAKSDLGWSSMQHILIEKHMIWQMANVSDSYFSYNMQIVIITRVISTSQDSTDRWKSVEVFLNGKTGDVTVMSGTHPTLHSRDGVKHFFLFQ